jgi:hypothetical protein
MHQQPDYASSSPTNALAIVSLISGILSWLGLFVFGGLIAIITGHMALNEIRNSYGSQSGEGLAIAGLILGYLNIIGGCIGLLIPIGILGASFLGCGICSVCGIFTEGFEISSLEFSNAVIPPIPLN